MLAQARLLTAGCDNGGLDEIIIPVDRLFSAYPALTVRDTAEKKLRNGNVIKLAAPNGTYRVYTETGGFLLLGEASDNKLKTIKSFFEV